MIQLSTLPATSPENPVKPASSADRDGAFAARLDKELGGGEQVGGKALPDHGKELPDALPEQGQAAQVTRSRANPFTDKIQVKAHVQLTANGSIVLGLRSSDEEAKPGDGGEAVTEAAIANPLAAMDLTQESTLTAAAALTATAAAGEGAEESADPVLGQGGNPRTMPARSAAPKVEILAQDQAALTQAAEGAEQQAAEGKQVDRGQVAQSVRLPGSPVSQELKVELSKGDRITNGAEPAASRAGQTASIVLPLTPATAQAQVPDALNLTHGTKQPFGAAGGVEQSVRPQDFTLLVDRLVEARESARGGAVNLSVMHADFGEVSLRFNHDNGNLSVAMASRDPDFARAVSAAASADGSQAGETLSQGGRRDDGGTASSSRMDSGANPSAGKGQSGRHRDAIHDASEQAEAQVNLASRDDRAARGGIYA